MIMEYLSGVHRSGKQLMHMLSNRAMDRKELSIKMCMCGGVNDSDGKKCISDNKTYFSLLLILLTPLFFDLCCGKTWAISSFFSSGSRHP